LHFTQTHRLSLLTGFAFSFYVVSIFSGCFDTDIYFHIFTSTLHIVDFALLSFRYIL